MRGVGSYVVRLGKGGRNGDIVLLCFEGVWWMGGLGVIWKCRDFIGKKDIE